MPWPQINEDKAIDAERYFKKILPNRTTRLAFRNSSVLGLNNYPEEFKDLQRAITEFELECKRTKKQNISRIVYRFYIGDYPLRRIAEEEKYDYSSASKLKKIGLEMFYKYIPQEERY